MNFRREGWPASCLMIETRYAAEEVVYEPIVFDVPTYWCQPVSDRRLLVGLTDQVFLEKL